METSNQINIIQSTLCKLLSNILFNVEVSFSQDIDWEKVYEESMAQTVVIPAFLNINELPLSDELRSKVKKSIQQGMIQNIQKHGYHAYLHQLMSSNGISYCVLKGVASASYYPDPLSRLIGDVDFLVDKKDVERAQSILEQEGFKPWEEEHICHIVLRKDRMHFELHFDPAGIPNGEAGERVRYYLRDILSTSHKIQHDDFEYIIPDDFHHALIMLIHMQHHLLAEGIGLRHLCDWAVFVNQFKEDEFEEKFKEPFEDMGLWTFAQILSHTAEMYIGLPHQKWMSIDDEISTSLMFDILSGGDFGVKDKQRQYEGMFISDRGKDGVDHHRIYQVCKVLNSVVYTHWPIVKKLKFLLPFGWIYFSFRRFFLIFTGKRKSVNLIKAFSSSAQRKSLYSKLKLFKLKSER